MKGNSQLAALIYPEQSNPGNKRKGEHSPTGPILTLIYAGWSLLVTYWEQSWFSGQNAWFARSESWVRIPEKSALVIRRASELNLFLSSNKVSLLTGEKSRDPIQGLIILSLNRSKELIMTIDYMLYISSTHGDVTYRQRMNAAVSMVSFVMNMVAYGSRTVSTTLYISLLSRGGSSAYSLVPDTPCQNGKCIKWISSKVICLKCSETSIHMGGSWFVNPIWPGLMINSFTICVTHFYYHY